MWQLLRFEFRRLRNTRDPPLLEEFTHHILFLPDLKLTVLGRTQRSQRNCNNYEDKNGLGRYPPSISTYDENRRPSQHQLWVAYRNDVPVVTYTLQILSVDEDSLSVPDFLV